MDDELLCNDSVIKVTASLHPVVVSKNMEVLVIQNFQLIGELQQHVLSLRVRGINKRSVLDILLGHFEDIIEKVDVLFVMLCAA